MHHPLAMNDESHTPVAGGAAHLLVSLTQLAHEPRPADEVGGKARLLAKLIAGGLPVPDGFVITAPVATLSDEDKAGIFGDIGDAAASLGDRLAVRSSAAMEDSVAAAAPGVFASVLDVAPRDLETAVRRVWQSARAPLVQAYANALELAPSPPLTALPMAVIVQRQVSSEHTRSGVLYTRLPGQPSSECAVLETHFHLDHPPGSVTLHRARKAPTHEREETGLEIEILARLLDLGLRAEAIIEAPSGADMEWVSDQRDSQSRLWIVQARPIVHPKPTPPFPGALLAFSRLDPAVTWHWDVTHNPDPLSPAQAGLVERMDRAGLAPYRMRVIGGYLYYADQAGSGQGSGYGHEQASDAESLRSCFENELAPAMEAALSRAEDPGADLLTVLEGYEQLYRVYAGQLSPLVSAARRALPTFLASAPELADQDAQRLAGRLLADGSPARLETLLDRVASGEAELADLLAAAGPMAMAWDVAAPTFAEAPQILHNAVARRTTSRKPADPAGLLADLRAKMSPESAHQLDAQLALAKVARDIGELDDRLYSRAQAALRAALLRQAKTWQLARADDIFFLPLDEVIRWVEEGETPNPIASHRRAQAGRAMRQRQQAWHMPLAFAAGEPVANSLDRESSQPHSRSGQRSGNRWSGRGTGGQTSGIALRVDDLANPPEPDAIPDQAIVVVPTVTPAMLFTLERAIGVVAQHGGLLDHGAAMARELGLPCVVDCAHVWEDIRSGDPLWMDGDRGLVVRGRGQL